MSSKRKRRGKKPWMAYLKVDGVRIRTDYYKTVEEAARACKLHDCYHYHYYYDYTTTTTAITTTNTASTIQVNLKGVTVVHNL